MPQSHTSQLYNCGGGQDGTTQHAGAHGQVRGDLEQGEQVRDHGAEGGKLVIHTLHWTIPHKRVSADAECQTRGSS